MTFGAWLNMNRVVMVLRIKGRVGIDPDVEKTLESLKLDKAFAAGLYPLTPSLEGMLRKAQRYLTWGRPNSKTIYTFLKEAGYVAEDALKFAEKLEKGESSLDSPVLLNLRPPSKGFKRSVKRAFKSGGEYGDRGDEINDLFRRMT
ncbi:MAG: uL30 family ribosomal protein [Candidatus Caldarchaeum sp.]|nr:uL30 family ribosomal protein [Candidatus Caldarchaeum sp.]